MTYYIVARFLDQEGRPREIVDETETHGDANYLLGEYRMAFGPETSISILTNPPKTLLADWNGE